MRDPKGRTGASGAAQGSRPTCGVSGVAKQRLETKVHVLLDMTVKQGETRLVGDHIHSVLPDARGRFAVELDKLEQVPVHVQRVSFVTAIVKHQPVAASLTELQPMVLSTTWGDSSTITGAIRRVKSGRD